MSVGLALGLLASAAAVDGAVDGPADGPADGVVVITGTREGYGAVAVGSATRTETPLVDVPQAVTVVTEREIEDRDLRSIADIVRTVPGAVAAHGEGRWRVRATCSSARAAGRTTTGWGCGRISRARRSNIASPTS